MSWSTSFRRTIAASGSRYGEPVRGRDDAHDERRLRHGRLLDVLVEVVE
jgi:hypothetical protein